MRFIRSASRFDNTEPNTGFHAVFPLLPGPPALVNGGFAMTKSMFSGRLTKLSCSPVPVRWEASPCSGKSGMACALPPPGADLRKSKLPRRAFPFLTSCGIRVIGILSMIWLLSAIDSVAAVR